MWFRILPLWGGLLAGITLGVESPGEPPNQAAELSPGDSGFTLNYGGAHILHATYERPLKIETRVEGGEIVVQRIRLQADDDGGVAFKAVIHASEQAIAAETYGESQRTFPIVRTSHGLSLNRRNNAVYDRFGDWMIEMPQGDTGITPVAASDGSIRFEVVIGPSNGPVEIIFRPRFYQKHRNIRYFKPWLYGIRKESVTGWCSWWAYHNEFRQQHVEELLDVWKEKNFADYGYRIVQIDDVFQGGQDAGRRNHPLNYGYVGGRPMTWLEWKEDRFPAGMTGYVEAVRRAGFVPGVWLGCFFSDEQTAEMHPDWFVSGADGKPAAGPYVSYAIDATVPEAADRLVRPTYHGLRNAGFGYVKIDQLRHLLYDNLQPNTGYAAAKGLEPADIFRAYLAAARQELGDETFILSCWGVLPESVGLADACRIGGDGYGPHTMQQYNSWNGIVWRNDPDHCDVRPRRKPAEEGNVRKTEAVTATSAETVIRPALASIAGGLLMLSDKPEVYRDERNLVGIRRSSPVLFSVPGQLYDFDSRKTDALKTKDRIAVVDGNGLSPIDGDRKGDICPWWLNEFHLGFDHWNVLHRLNWSGEAAGPETVRFEDLGLDPAREYLVFEFWTDRLLGTFKNSFEAPEIGAMGLHSFAIRAVSDRPQLVSTNRHLSQGAADLETMAWEEERILVGRSRVVADDRYVITLRVPDGHVLRSATFDGRNAEVSRSGNLVRASFLPAATDSVGWRMEFDGGNGLDPDGP